MRPVREIAANEENFRIQQAGPGFLTLKCDPVEPEPVGTIILRAFRVAGYDPDCDGSLMARLDSIDANGKETGWSPKNLGLDPETTLVVTAEELRAMFGTNPGGRP